MLGRLGRNKLNDLIPCTDAQMHKWGLRAADLRPSEVSGTVGEAMLTCELGSVAWMRVGNPFMCFFCPLQVLWGVATPLLPLEKGQHGRAGSCWCLDHSERLDRAPSLLPKSLQNPSRDPHRDGHKEAAKGKQLFSKGRSQGVLLMLGFLRATRPGAAAVPGEAPSHARLLQMLPWLQGKKKAGDKAETSVELGRCFGGPHCFYLL